MTRLQISRRATYLLIWGIAYAALGAFLNATAPSYQLAWGISFGSIGLIAIISALTDAPKLDTLAFSLLTMVTAARASWFVIDFIITGNFVDIFGAILWSAVSMAQLVVAGWPDTPIVINSPYEQEKNGAD